jgi:hypothetical protein
LPFQFVLIAWAWFILKEKEWIVNCDMWIVICEMGSENWATSNYQKNLLPLGFSQREISNKQFNNSTI